MSVYDWLLHFCIDLIKINQVFHFGRLAMKRPLCKIEWCWLRIRSFGPSPYFEITPWYRLLPLVLISLISRPLAQVCRLAQGARHDRKKKKEKPIDLTSLCIPTLIRIQTRVRILGLAGGAAVRTSVNTEWRTSCLIMACNIYWI